MPKVCSYRPLTVLSAEPLTRVSTLSGKAIHLHLEELLSELFGTFRVRQHQIVFLVPKYCCFLLFVKDVLLQGGFGTFLHPKSRELVNVPDIFDSVDDYWVTLMSNHLCDYYHFFKQISNPPLPPMFTASVKTEKMASTLSIDDSKQSLPSDGNPLIHATS
jgi:hypothetical protein